MNLKLFLIVIAINTSLCLLQYLFQLIDLKNNKIAPRHSLITGTNQKFLYWQDFYMQTYGDFLGLVWIMNAFAHLLIAGKIFQSDWIIFVPVFFLGIILTLNSCLSRDHKPDWGFPEVRKISVGGISHLPYFGLNSAMAVICFIKMVSGQLTGILMWTYLFGGALIMLMAIADYKAGHFEGLKKSF